MGIVDIIDPTMSSIKRLINFDRNSDDSKVQKINSFSEYDSIRPDEENLLVVLGKSDFDLDSFIKNRLSLDLSQLDVSTEISNPARNTPSRRI